MKLFKKMAFLLAAFMVLASPIACAAEAVEAEVTEVQEELYSNWAIPTLNDATKTGVDYLLGDKNLKAQITAEQLKQLTDNLQSKIDGEKLTADKSNKSVEIVGEVNTRENVLNAIFNIVAKYDANAPKGEGVVEYFVEKGVLLGDENGQRLEDVATVEEAIIMADRALTKLFNDKGVSAKGLFWKVENNGNTVYMLGSIHLANSTLYPIRQEIIDAFEASDELVLEIVMDNPEGLAYLQSKQLYEDGKTLKDDIGEELFAGLAEIFTLIGLDEESLGQLKPWAVYLSLTNLSAQAQGETDGPTTQITGEHGIDMHFLDKANDMDMHIDELESYQFQADLFDNVPVETYIELFQQTLDNIAKAAENPEAFAEESKETAEAFPKMLKAWKDGDRKAMAEILASASDDPLNQVIFGQRDKNMADGIEKLLNSDEKKTYFVIVGAGHLAPENSATGYLTDKGFKVENLNIN